MVETETGPVSTPRVKRPARIALQVLVSGGILALLLYQIDLSSTAELIRSSHWGYVALAFVIFLATTWLMAWRWQILLASKGIHEPLGWLTRLYFIGYAAGQILPTAMGGDAVRIIEHSRRRPDVKAEVAGAVVIERVIGAVGTLVLVAVGLAFAVGRYDDIAAFVWIEAAGILALTVIAVLLFSRRTRRLLEERIFPLGSRVKLDRPLERVHWALHGYRHKPGVLAATLALTIATQLARIGSIWLCGKAVGVDISPVVYIILGPLLFLVMLVPFTINGLGVREAFFVAFLGRFGVDADAAFATGFLFYAVTIAVSIPGGIMLLWRSVRPAVARPREG
jgi:glycosyltransferase 2 family protein